MFYQINNINYKSTIQGDILNIPEIDRELGIDKRNDKFIITDVKTGAKIIESDTKDEVIKELLKIKNEINSITIDKENSLITQLDKLVDYDTYIKYLDIFSNVFGHHIVTFCDIFIYNFTKRLKLDIVKFDNLFKYEPEYLDISLSEFINNKYGEDVLKVVKYFI